MGREYQPDLALAKRCIEVNDETLQELYDRLERKHHNKSEGDKHIIKNIIIFKIQDEVKLFYRAFEAELGTYFDDIYKFAGERIHQARGRERLFSIGLCQKMMKEKNNKEQEKE